MTEIPSKIFQKIRKLQYETSNLADDMMAGAWRSAFRGQGMEFDEVREYQSGDDVRLIDWHVTARMDRPYLKVFEEERELTVLLAVDVSASSRFSSQNQLKRDIIAEIGAVLAFSAIKNNDKIGLILFSEDIEKYIPPKSGTRHVLRIIRELLAFEPKRPGTDLKQALTFINKVRRKSAICFLISDFICKEAEHELSLVASRHDLIAISVTDPYENEFPDSDLVAFTDLETGLSRLIDTSAENARTHFKAKALERINHMEETMDRLGGGFIDIRTDKPYIPSLQKFFKIRQKRR